MWKETIPLQRLIETGGTMCVAAKWLDEKPVYFTSEWTSGKKKMLKFIAKMLNEADCVVTYNGNKFDIPTLNKEFLLNGINPPSPFKSIDLYRTVRSRFRFASNKLDHVAQQLGAGKKVEHAGFQMWIDCMNGVASARKQMEKYNIGDVLLLEKVYYHLYPWVKNKPNRALLIEHVKGENVCPSCGGKHIQKRGYTYTGAAKYQRFACMDCGSWSRSRASISHSELQSIN